MFSFSVITKSAIIYADAQRWPTFGFLSPDVPPSVFEQLLSDTQGTVCLSCVGIFFYPSFFCVLSGMFYSCMLVPFPFLPVLFLPNL